MDLLVEESDVCGVRLISAAELRKGGTKLLSVRAISPSMLHRNPGQWLALARQPGVVVAVIDAKSPHKKPVYLHTSDLEEGSIAAIEYCVRHGVYPEPEEDSSDE